MTNAEVYFTILMPRDCGATLDIRVKKWSVDATIRPRTESVVRGDWRWRSQHTKSTTPLNNKNGQLSATTRLCFQLVGLSPYLNLPVVAEVQTWNQRAPVTNTFRAPAARCSRNIACEI